MTTDHDDAGMSTGTGMGRRRLLAAAGGAVLAPMAAGSVAAQPVLSARRQGPPTGEVAFQWLGTAGWRVSTPSTTLLVDPYLTRFDTGLAGGAFDATTTIEVDPAAIDAALGEPGSHSGAVDAVFITHTHWDHFADVPHIAKTRGATVYTTLSGYHLGQAMGLPGSQIAVVKGGEELRVGDAVVRVVRSLHSRTNSGGLLFPGVRTQETPAPETIADLPEGDTLGFVIRGRAGAGGVLLLGASDYDEQALQDLDVDTVALPLPSNDVTADYVGRLLRALDRPRTVVLVHWDNFETPLRNPPRADEKSRRRMREVTEEVKRVSPRTRVLEPTYLAPMRLL